MGEAKRLFDAEMKKIKRLTAEETKQLFGEYQKSADKNCKALVEGNLWRVAETAVAFEVDDAVYMDLIQEGSEALIRYFENSESFDEELDATLDGVIYEAMQQFMNGEEENQKVNRELVNKLNALDYVTKKIAETKGREATKEELAELMNLPEDEIDYLLKVALSVFTKEE